MSRRGATRSPGEHQLGFGADTSPLGKLPSGDYHLVVEAAREVGGRELLRLPFQWPPQAPRAVQAKGQRELGAIALAVKP